MQKLEVDTAGRIADYDSSGAAFVWKAGVNWTLIDDIRYRMTFSRDFRAPSVNDLYSTPLISNGTVIRDSVPTINGAANPNFQGSPTIQTLSGGNPKLKPETANTFTAGVVLSPRFIPGFTTSIDYYKIDMGNALTTFTRPECGGQLRRGQRGVLRRHHPQRRQCHHGGAILAVQRPDLEGQRR